MNRKFAIVILALVFIFGIVNISLYIESLPIVAMASLGWGFLVREVYENII